LKYSNRQEKEEEEKEARPLLPVLINEEQMSKWTFFYRREEKI